MANWFGPVTVEIARGRGWPSAKAVLKAKGRLPNSSTYPMRIIVGKSMARA